MSSSGPSFWQMFCSAMAAMFGVQSEHNRQRDFGSGIAWHWLLIGLAVTAGFVLFVIFLVGLALSLAGA